VRGGLTIVQDPATAENPVMPRAAIGAGAAQQVLGLPEIAARLWYDGAIRSPEAFVALSLAHGTYRSLRAGEYEVPPGATTSEVLKLLESGHVRRHVVLLREGDTVAELGRALDRERILPYADFARAASDPVFLRVHAIEGSSVEGYLFPDTYQFVRGMTAEQIEPARPSGA